MARHNDNLVWYAGTNEITRLGPFESQLDAWEALRLAPTYRGRAGRVHPEGAYVWPERAPGSARRGKG